MVGPAIQMPEWLPAPGVAHLEGNEAHVWRASLDLDASSVDRLSKALSQDEQSRVRRMPHPAQRTRFMAARGILRDILSRYLACPPDAVRLDYGPGGRPRIAWPVADNVAGFNMSHSRDKVLYAVAPHALAGVDIQTCEEPRCPEDIVGRFFTDAERRMLDGLADAEYRDRFLLCWTRKEAVLKALGTGLRGGLGSVETSCPRGRPATTVSSRLSAGVPGVWTFVDLEPYAGFRGAVAVAGPHPRFRYFNWSPETTWP